MNLKKYSSDYYFPICSKVVIALLILIDFTFSCTSALYIPASHQETANASLAELQTGRKLYIRKCAGCHTLYLPEKYTKAEWHHWVDKMTQKVSIDTLEKEQILKYLSKGK